VKQAHLPSAGDRRRAAKLFLAATKLFEKEQFEAAMQDFDRAASLDPSNDDYRLAADVARGHAVTALIQDATRAQMHGNEAATRASLASAMELDPKNEQVADRLRQLGDDALLGVEKPRNEPAVAEGLEVTPAAGIHSFHVRAAQRQVIEQVFKAFGIEATVDQSVQPRQVRIDLDDATFPQAMRALSLLTGSFYVPLDPHRVLVARDNSENRLKFMPQELETIYLPGLPTAELTELGNMARNVFEVTQVVAEQSNGTLTVRAPRKTLNALNETLRALIDGRDQVLIEVRLIQIAHTSEHNTGAQLPQSLTAFNVYSEEQQILNSNATLVQQIISQGLAAPGDVEAIIAILVASGQVTGSIFSNGLALFGGGLTLSGLSPPPLSANFNLNSSDSRELDQLQLRLGDGEAGTVRTGEKYPIMTSSYSSLGTGGINIPGLNTAGVSSALGGLASSLGLGGSSAGLVPQVQYQDLGLTLKATPKVLRNGDVALTIDLKIDALGGTSLNGVPILDNRAYSGVVTLPSGEGVAVVSELNKQESRAISGVPGLSEIPGLNDLTGKDTQKSYSTLLVVMTPHLIRGTQLAGHTPMMRIEVGKRAGT
jgi:general secretion pathway protein D